MLTYTLNEDNVQWNSGGVFYSAPMDMKNIDCVQFLRDWQAGATVYESDGMTLFTYSYDRAQTLGLTA